METYKKRVLIAPLDWGFGHTVRCIPIIQEFLAQGAEVVLGGYGRSYHLLKKEFPSLQIVNFPGIAVEYPSQGNLAWSIFKQLPKIVSAIIKEHFGLRKIIKEHNIDIVVSDNRYGLYTKKIPCIFVVTQIHVLMPKVLLPLEPLLSGIIKHFIRKYNECWIVDFPGEKNLTGTLSHNISLPKNIFFIGAQSRMQSLPQLEKDIDVLAILSPPEPLRTRFEEILLEQMQKTEFQCVIVQGKTELSTTTKIKNVTLFSTLTANQLIDVIARSRYIVSRSGHSTIMDFAALGISAIFVPTPGQTEHEYLARFLKEQNICYSVAQSDFQLLQAIEESKNYTGFQDFVFSRAVLQERITLLLKNGNNQ